MARTYLKKQAAASRPFGPVLTALGYAMMSQSLMRAVRFDPDPNAGDAGGGDVKMSISKIRDGMKACSAELDALEASYDKEETDEGKSKVQTQIDAKNKELDKYEQQLKRVEAKSSRTNRLATVTRLAQLAPAGVNPVSIPAEGKTPEEQDLELVKAFGKFCIGKSLSGNELEALRPRSKSWGQSSDARDGVRIPAALMAIINAKFYGKAGALASNANTGNKLVWPEYINQIERFETEPPILFSRVRKLQTKNGEVILPVADQETDSYAGVSAAWTAEGAEPDYSEPTFRQVDITQHEVAAKTVLTNRLLARETLNIESFLTDLFGEAIMNKIETAIISGDGVGKPKGILTAGNYVSVARAGGGAIAFNDIVATMWGIPPQLRKRGIFLTADDAQLVIVELKDSQNRPLYIVSLRDGEPDTLVGKPVFPTTRLTKYALGDITYCDPSRYVLTIEDEIVVAKSEHEKFSERKTVFIAYACVGGNPMTKYGAAALAV